MSSCSKVCDSMTKKVLSICRNDSSVNELGACTDGDANFSYVTY